MNDRGFTLIELLATIAVLALVITITYSSVMAILNNSKKSTEEAFVKSLSNSMKDYIAFKASNFTYSKCIDENDLNCKNSLNKYFDCDIMSCPIYYSSFTLDDLRLSGITDGEDFINPRNNEKCDGSSRVVVYRDSKYRYCFKTEMNCYTDSSGNKIEVSNCDFLSEGE